MAGISGPAVLDRGHVNGNDDQQDRPGDADDLLAARLGLPLTEFWHLAGSSWQHVDVAPELGQGCDWYAAGEPLQVMLGLAPGSSDVLVGRPEGRWGHRGHGLSYVPSSPVAVERLEDLSAAVSAVCQARRRAFRWCRYCRLPTPPEYRDEPDVCMSCAERVLGVVH